ncbi:MAG TPA: hypothetical protein VKZ93_00710 [Arenibacter sp.]|nr:hypothetical protein [Arenibacter sp.]
MINPVSPWTATVRSDIDSSELIWDFEVSGYNLHLYAALHHYLQITEEIPILPSLKILISEFIKYTVGRLPFYYPPMLPEEMIADDVKTGEIKKDLWIPLEDMNDGWEKSGAVGQEVYGAGLPYGIIPRQYFIIHNLGAMGFVDYPTSRFRFGKRSVTFHINGNGFLKSKLILLNLGKKTLSTIKVEMKYKKGYRKIGPSNRSLNEFVLDGHGMVRISWS